MPWSTAAASTWADNAISAATSLFPYAFWARAADSGRFPLVTITVAVFCIVLHVAASLLPALRRRLFAAASFDYPSIKGDTPPLRLFFFAPSAHDADSPLSAAAAVAGPILDASDSPLVAATAARVGAVTLPGTPRSAVGATVASALVGVTVAAHNAGDSVSSSSSSSNGGGASFAWPLPPGLSRPQSRSQSFGPPPLAHESSSLLLQPFQSPTEAYGGALSLSPDAYVPVTHAPAPAAVHTQLSSSSSGSGTGGYGSVVDAGADANAVTEAAVARRRRRRLGPTLCATPQRSPGFSYRHTSMCPAFTSSSTSFLSQR
jgi:hypothetical protein